MTNNLPKRTKPQMIGSNACELLSSVLTKFCNVISVPQDRDFGIDLICEIIDKEHPTGKLFNVQCKGIDELKIPKNNDLISITIAVTTLNYWLLQPNPTFLFVVDYQNNIFYWTFPQEFLASLKTKWKEQKTVSIPVSLQDSFSKDVETLPPQLLSIVNSMSSRTAKNGDYLATLSLGNAIDKAFNLGLTVLRSPFHRPFQYIGMSIKDVSQIVKTQPNGVGNIIVESNDVYMLLEAEGNYISYVDIQLKKTAPWSMNKAFDSEAILAVFSINPSELELVRKRIDFHTYYDHKRKLKISVACHSEGEPLSIMFSSKYYLS